MRALLLRFTVLLTVTIGSSSFSFVAEGQEPARPLVAGASSVQTEGLYAKVSAVATALATLITVGLFALTLRSLQLTRESLDVTRRALALSALVSESEIAFREHEQRADGTALLGGESSYKREEWAQYFHKIREARERIEALG